MKYAIAVACLAAITMFASSAAAATDPRKCDDKPAAACAQTAATIAFRKQLGRITHRGVWSGPLTCTPSSGLLRWRCDFTAGIATITFRALSNGWHTKVAIACKDAAAKPAAACL